MKILRDIKQLIFKTSLFTKVREWGIDGTDIFSKPMVLFPDGIIGINSNSKVSVEEYQETNYAKFYSDYRSLLSKYALKDMDVFLGRDSNYILFRDGITKLENTSLEITSDSSLLTSKELNVVSDSSLITSKVLDVVSETSIEVTTPILTLNGVGITVVAGKLFIGGKEVAVVGGDIDPTTNKITVSGQ